MENFKKENVAKRKKNVLEKGLNIVLSCAPEQDGRWRKLLSSLGLNLLLDKISVSPDVL